MNKLHRAKTMELQSASRDTVVIHDEGFQPLRSKLVPNSNPHPNSSRIGSRIGSTMTDMGSRKSHAAIEHGLLMQYQAPVLIVKKPKHIGVGPFDIYDVPQLRLLKDNFRKDYHRQVQNRETSMTFFNDLDIGGYLTNKNNWLNTSKFMNTSSFYSAVNVYLPLIKDKNLNVLKKKYESERNSRVQSSLRSTLQSTEVSRLGSTSRMMNL
jgi:hypothetical protein